MTVRKKFDRPVHFDADEDPSTGRARRINLTREGSALEGAYAAFASTEAVRLSPYETARREIFSSGVKAWIGLMLFWAAIALLASTFIFAR